MFRLLLHDFTTEDRIRAAIKNYGCNMRSLIKVLEDPRAVHNTIDSKLNGLSLDAVAKLLVGYTTGPVQESRSDALITTLCVGQPEPDDERYSKSDKVCRTLAGAVIYKRLIFLYGRNHYKEVRNMASVFGRIGPAASAGGWLWEGWCHDHIPSQTYLDLIPMVNVRKNLVLSNQQPERIEMGSLAHQVYTRKDTVDYTSDPGKYYIPNEPNNATFDAFFRCEEEQTGIALQMTIGTGHSLAESGLKDLENRLEKAKKCYFVFVIPKGQQFKLEQLAVKWQSLFRFFTLALDNSKYCWSPLDL